MLGSTLLCLAGKMSTDTACPCCSHGEMPHCQVLRLAGETTCTRWMRDSQKSFSRHSLCWNAGRGRRKERSQRIGGEARGEEGHLGNVKREKSAEEENSSQLSVARRHELWANKCCANRDSKKKKFRLHTRRHTHTKLQSLLDSAMHIWDAHRKKKQNVFLLENKEYSSVYVS